MNYSCWLMISQDILYTDIYQNCNNNCTFYTFHIQDYRWNFEKVLLVGAGGLNSKSAA